MKKMFVILAICLSQSLFTGCDIFQTPTQKRDKAIKESIIDRFKSRTDVNGAVVKDVKTNNGRTILYVTAGNQDLEITVNATDTSWEISASEMARISAALN